MTERFERLYKLPENLYAIGSPVIISAGALLKDTETGSIVVQLKFHSVSEKCIKAVKISIIAYDVSGKEIDGIEDYQYLDLHIANGQDFGANKAIVMPNAVTRSFAIGSITVVFANGTAKDVSTPMMSLPKETFLQSVLKDIELVKQYKLAVNDESAYIPQETDNLWMCSCGEWNCVDSCTKCGAKKTVVFSAFDMPTLTDKMTSRLVAEQAQREEQQRLAEIERQQKSEQDRIAAEEETIRKTAEAEKRKKTAKKVTIATVVVIPVLTVVLVFALWLYPDVLKPNMIYKEAERLFSEGYYSDAATAFQELGDFKDSPERLNEVVKQMLEDIYNNGIQLIQDEKYESALQKFEKIIEYGIDPSLIVKAEYQKAICLSELGSIEDAIVCLENIPDYPDSSETLKKFKYQYACELFVDCKYLESIELFNTIPDYLDSTQKIESAYSLYYFDRGNTYYEEAKFYLAIEEFKKSKEENASEMIVEAEKEIAYINSICGVYGLVEKVSWGDEHTIYPANTESCTISFDFEKGKFVFDSYIYASDHYFEYNFEKTAQYYFRSSDYYYMLENERLLWYEDENNYRYYEKE